MTRNHSTINVETKNSKKNVNITSIHLGFILYHTYRLLYCKRHIQMTGNYSTMDMEKESN